MNQLPDSLNDTKAEFLRLTSIWKKDTIFLSSLDTLLSHDAYQTILSMGPVILPFIFENLRDEGGFWFHALQQLTKENPIPDEMGGRIQEMKTKWLEYGKEHHYID